jgi:hypothetical protein
LEKKTTDLRSTHVPQKRHSEIMGDNGMSLQIQKSTVNTVALEVFDGL